MNSSPGTLHAPIASDARFWRTRRGALKSLLIGFIAAVVGAGLVWLAVRFGSAAPIVMIAVPAVPLLTLAIALDHRIGFLVVFATFPLSTYVSSIGVLPLQPVEVAVLYVAVVIVLMRIARGASPVVGHRALIGAAGLLTWALVALPSAPDRSLALSQTFSLLAGIVFAMLVVTVCTKMKDVRVVLVGLVTIAGATAVWALASGGPPELVRGGATIADRLRGPFNQPNQLGSFCAAMAIVALGLMLGSEKRRTRLVAGFAALALLAALALSLSRGGWVGAIVGLAVFALGAPLVRGSVAIPLVLAAVTAFLFVGGSDNVQVRVVGARLAAFTERGPYDSRPEIWAEAWRQLEADLVTGQGPGNFPVVSGRSVSEAKTVHPDHAHNLLLNWGAELGLPAVFLIVLLTSSLGLAARQARLRARAHGRLGDASVIAGCAGALVSVFVHGLFDYPLRNQVLWIMLWSLIGLLLASARSIPSRSWTSDSSHRPENSRASDRRFAI